MTFGRRFACAVGTHFLVERSISDEIQVNCFIFWLLVQGSNVFLKNSMICISMNSYHQPLSDTDVVSLVRRMELEPKLLRRHLEEQIIELVPLDDAWLDENRIKLLDGRSQDDFLSRTCKVL